MDDKIKKINENQDKLIKESLVDAEKHGNKNNSVNLLRELAETNNIDLSDIETYRKNYIPPVFNDDLTYKELDNDEKSENIFINKKVYVPKNESEKKENTTLIKTQVDNFNTNDYETYLIDDFDIPHDIVPLPSKGLIYKNIKSKIPVSYLTASDEDLITSPNLYMNGKVIDVLLRKKILDKKINPDELCKGDRDAVIIWLRASGYGELFPVYVTDPITGEKFETEVDLSKLKYKDFSLTPDEDGLFEFTLPKTKDVVKFRFLTYKDDIEYTRLLENDNNELKKITLNNSIQKIKDIVENDNDLKAEFKLKIERYYNELTPYLNNIKNDTSMFKNVTFLLEKSIVSINGNKNSNYIKKYINIMPAYDSMSLRRYMNDNTPGVDFKVTIERPKSLGGGSFETFLELDNDFFLNFT